MEIQTLQLTITEEDLTQMMTQHQPKDVPLRELQVRIELGGIRLKGKYPMGLMTIPFDTFWQPTVENGIAHVTLEEVSIVGMPAGLLQGVFLGNIRRLTANEPGVEVEGNVVKVDVEKGLAAKGIPLKLNLKKIICQSAKMILESSAS